MARGGHDSLNFHAGPPCPALYILWAGHPKNSGLRAEPAACGRILPLWTLHAVRPCIGGTESTIVYLIGFHPPEPVGLEALKPWRETLI
jgi:hypothetical protein